MTTSALERHLEELERHWDRGKKDKARGIRAKKDNMNLAAAATY